MLGFRIQRRDKPLGFYSAFVVLAAVVLALLFSGGILALRGTPPVEGMRVLLQSAFGSRWALEDSLAKAVPIFLCSLGVGVTFRLQIWNIGAEGQYAMGAVGATWAALTLPGLPWYLLLPLMGLVSFGAGAVWGLVPAFFRLRWQVNEIIVTLMFNYIAILFLEFLVYGAWKDPVSFGFPMTPTFSDNAIIPMIGMTRLNWGIVLCVLAGIAIWVFFQYTRLGFELAACGENVRAARYAGMPYNLLVYLVMGFSGGLAALAACIEVSANLNRLQPSVMAGYGYTAIVVAWLARLNPLAIAVASFLLAGLRVGTENLQLELQVPSAFGSIMEGLILLTVLAGSFFIDYQVRRRGRS